MSGTLYIRDDYGHAWYFHDGRICCVLSDLDPDPENENGYACDTWEEGIRILNESGYITGFEADDYNLGDMEYFTRKPEEQ